MVAYVVAYEVKIPLLSQNNFKEDRIISFSVSKEPGLCSKSGSTKVNNIFVECGKTSLLFLAQSSHK